MTLDEAIVVLRRLQHTVPLDVRELAAVRVVCHALTDHQHPAGHGCEQVE